MSKHDARLDAIERAQCATKGQRIFIVNDARITENGEPRTRADIEDARAQGFEVIEIEVIHEERTIENES